MLSKELLACVFLLLLPLTNSLQTPDSCEGDGLYCFADSLYECEGGEPILLEDCPSTCKDLECVKYVTDPGLTYIEDERKEEAADSSLLLELTLAVLVLAILAFAVRIKKRKSA